MAAKSEQNSQSSQSSQKIAGTGSWKSLELIHHPEWSQLQEAEEYFRRQREKLQRAEVRTRNSHWPMQPHQQAPRPNRHLMEDLDRVNPEEVDLEFITSILDSFTNQKSTQILPTPGENLTFYEESFQVDA